jgi:hypothetical protein
MKLIETLADVGASLEAAERFHNAMEAIDYYNTPVARAAHMYNVSVDLLEAQQDRAFLVHAASNGFDV